MTTPSLPPSSSKKDKPLACRPLAFRHWCGLKPKRRMSFTLADGTEIERDVSECYIELPQGDGHTPVVLGEKGDDALLGAVTLEILGLVLNPFPLYAS